MPLVTLVPEIVSSRLQKTRNIPVTDVLNAA